MTARAQAVSAGLKHEVMHLSMRQLYWIVFQQAGSLDRRDQDTLRFWLDQAHAAFIPGKAS